MNQMEKWEKQKSSKGKEMKMQIFLTVHKIVNEN